MENSNLFNCFLIGDGSLLIQCGEQILSKGHTILGIITLNQDIVKWADEKNISTYCKDGDYGKYLSDIEFDYLFSIVNLSMIPSHILSIPKKMTINYHDSLLPSYAGIHATSWALMNGETSHGITWHIVSEEVDKGNILKQYEIDIERNETAFTLNFKCYQKALEAFSELIDELSINSYVEMKQDFLKRSYFGKFKRPEAGCVILWDKSAEDIDNFVRGLDFGKYKNELGVPKLAFNDKFLIVENVQILDARSEIEPGTIIDIKDNRIRVSTITRDVLFQDLKRLDGSIINAKDLVKEYGLKSGKSFNCLDSEQIETLTELYGSYTKNENFWANKISSLNPASIPWIDYEINDEKRAIQKLSLEIPQAFINYIKEKHEQWELGTALLSAFAAFLLRVGEESELDIGCSYDGLRNKIKGVENFFASSIPLRVSVDKKSKFSDFYTYITNKLEEIKDMGTYPLDIAVRYPEVTCVLTEVEALSTAVAFDFVDYSDDYLPLSDYGFCLTIFKDINECSIFYSHVISNFQATTLAERFNAFLEALVEMPDESVIRLPIMPTGEFERVVVEWNNTRVDNPEVCMHKLFKQRVEENPHSIAAIFKDKEISYIELDERSSTLAAFLRNKGVKPGIFVGVFIERSIDMLISLLGIMKAGGAYVPLDPVYPSDRLSYMIEEAKLDIILSQKAISEKLPMSNSKIICVDSDWTSIEMESKGLKEEFEDVNIEDSAYVIFTSGSTGKPKGVEVLHKGLTNFLCSMAKLTGFTNSDRILALTTICFDISGLELYLPLITGGQVEILSSNVARDGFKLKDIIENSQVTMVQATPATFEMLLAAGWEKKVPIKILCGGEPLGRELANQLSCLSDELLNVYGPTETTIWSSASRILPNEEITIGRPIDNTQIYILDRHLNPVPIGVAGELFIGGDGVAKGYLNRQDLTEERFLPNKFVGNGSIYKTGDLAKFLHDGRVVCMGRADSQIKLRGFRIEIGEIETAIEKQEEVIKAVVVMREDNAGVKNLTAFLKTKKGTGMEFKDNLTERIRTFLPEYMIPSYFYFVDSYPLTLNKKVDKKPLISLEISEILQKFGTNDSLNLSVNETVVEEQLIFDTDKYEEFLKACVEQDISKIVADMLKANIKDLDMSKPLGQYGFESIRFTSLSMKVKEKLTVQLTPAIFYTFNNIIDIASHIIDKHRESIEIHYEARAKEFMDNQRNNEKINNSLDLKTKRSKNVKKKWKPNKNEKEPIAIIGIGGRLPQSEDLIEFWDNLVKKKDLITEIPRDRWDYRDFDETNSNTSLTSNSKWGGFIKDADKFDAAFFNISPREAEVMDPQQRVFLETVWEAIEDSGYRPSELSGTKTGVFAGVVSNDYWDLISNSEGNMDAYTVSGNIDCIIANRISYILNLTGVSATVETACSSSLVAIHRAVSSIRSGECEMAVAGGINLMFSPHMHIALSKNGMLNKDGKCKAFDKSGNGYVRSEGSGVLILKPLSVALEDGDYIYGIIKGSYENHGGRTNSMTAPNPLAHAELVASAIEQADIDPSTVTYIEAHGTGTSLGDPIEINGLKKAFESLYKKWDLGMPNEVHCGIGSVKTSVGHLESAAGVTGLLKILLSMKYGLLPGMVHFEELNPYIDLEGSPFYMVEDTKKWNRLIDKDGSHVARRAGVSSFGFGGSNAHVFVEEYDNNSRSTPYTSSKPCIVVISAKNKDRLKAYAMKFIRFIDRITMDSKENEVNLEDMSYTLQIGREMMDERLAIVASSFDEVKKKLMQFEAGEKDIDNLYTGNMKEIRKLNSEIFEGDEAEDFIRNIIQKGKNEKVAQLWVMGVDIDWEILYSGRTPVRIPIPTYPFDKVRFWLPETVKKSASVDRIQGGFRSLHPFIDVNESTLEEQRYKKIVRKEEFFLKDHVVEGKLIFPGVAYLEMARAAGTLANNKATVFTMKNNVWFRPFILEQSQAEIFISLKPNGDMVNYEIHSYQGDGNKVIHAQGRLGYISGDIPQGEFVDIISIKNRCKGNIDHEKCYKMFHNLGFQYGRTFKPIVNVSYNETESLAYIELPKERKADMSMFGMHPSMLEGGLQAVIGILANESEDSETPYLPFGSGEVEIYGDLPDKCYVYMKLIGNQSTSGSDIRKFNIHITDLNGKLLVKMKDYSIRGIPAETKKVPKKHTGHFISKWQECNIHNDNLVIDKSNILVFTEEKQYYEEIEKQTDATVTLVSQGNCFKKIGDKTYEINPALPKDYEMLIDDLKNCGVVPSRIVHAWSNELFSGVSEIIESQIENSAYSMLYLAKEITKVKATDKVKIIYAYHSPDEFEQPQYTGINGLIKCIGLENPKLDIKTVGFDSVENSKLIAKIMLEEFKAWPDDRIEIRYQKGKRFAKSIKPFDLKNEINESNDVCKDMVVKQNGVYVITGGLGGLGLIFAKYLAKQQKIKLVLVGRSKNNAEKEAKIRELENIGAEVIYIEADVSSFEEVQRLVENIRKRFGGINGVIHAAGIIKDSLFINKKIEEMKAVVAPKVHGTIYLDEATKCDNLDFFVMFSSITSFAGNIGQSDYGYANGFMDGYAILREQLRKSGERNGKALAINWALWKDGGMSISEQNRQFIEKNTGIGSLDTESGLEAFTLGLKCNESGFLTVHGDIKRVFSMLEDRTRRRESSTSSVSEAVTAPIIKKAVEGGTEISESIKNDLLKISSQILKINENIIDMDEKISEYGFDSLSNTEFANEINNKYSLDVTPVLFFEYTTINSIAEYLQDEYKQQMNSYYGKKYPNNVDGFVDVKPIEEVVQYSHKPVVKKTLQSDTNIFESIKNDLIKMSSEILKINESVIDSDEKISEYGFDSLSNTEFANVINSKYNLDITPILFFEYTTISSIAKYLQDEYGQQMETYYGGNSKIDDSTLVEVETKVENEKHSVNNLQLYSRFSTEKYEITSNDFVPYIQEQSVDPVAIIGIDGVMPGSENFDEFWKYLTEGIDLITEVPEDRWDWNAYFGDPKNEKNKTYSKWGGFLKEVDKFDAEFFKISDKEADLMDPQQRIFLETVWRTIEDAGYMASELSGTNTGVYVGVTNRDYLDYLRQNTDEILPESTFGNNHSFLVNRISYTLNLHGPSEPIDTLCSSSLTAIHRAVTDIQCGNCEMAIAGGISIIISPNLNIAFNKAGMLSKDGKCMTFDANANGFVRGEGAGALLLKPLSKAKADGDRIYAVIKGTAENHGGRANSMTSPSVNAQADLMVKAFEKAAIEPETLTFIENHGTGTNLGDPIEVNALKKAFKELYKKKDKEMPDKPYCGLGTVKTNIGHLESAAGIAGILKVILSMKYGKIPPSINLKELNPYINLEGSPFYIVDRLTEWKRIKDENGKEIPRRAAVSAFGAGGLNANIILEEYIDESKEIYVSHKNNVFLISAKNEERLKEYAKKMLEHFIKNNEKLNFEDIAFTLQVGRESMEERISIVADNINVLINKLTSYCKGEQPSDEIYYRGKSSDVYNNPEILPEGLNIKDFGKKLIANGNLHELAKMWASGVEIQWKELYKDASLNRVSLPTYPFARKRHWVEENSVIAESKQIKMESYRTNVTDKELSWIFKKGEPFMRDHTVYGDEVLLGVTYISMVIEAARNVYSTKKLSGMRSVVFSNPMSLGINESAHALVDIDKRGERSYFITKYKKSTQSDYISSSTGECIFGSMPATKPFDLKRLENMKGETLNGKDVYREKWTDAPVVYGSTLRTIRKLKVNAREAFGEIALTEEIINTRNDFNVHPALLDGAVLCGMFAFLRNVKETYIPFMVNDVYIFSDLPQRCFCYARYVKLNSEVMISDIYILNEKGEVLIVLKGLTCKHVKTKEYLGEKANKVNGKLKDVKSKLIDSETCTKV